MGGGGKGGNQTIGFRYYMSLHMGLCRGPVDEIVQIKVGDMRAWPFPEKVAPDGTGIIGLITNAILRQNGKSKVDDTMTAALGPNGNAVVTMLNGEIYTLPPENIRTWRHTGQARIDAPVLFGGDKKEGGVAGSVEVLMGARNQIVPGWIKNLMGGRVPDFRGVVTLFFDGLLTSMNPYPKKWEFRVRRTESGWDGAVWQPSLVTIWMREGSIKAMNPAHIIYECLTNREWGRGMSRDLLLESEWVKAAQTLYNENFGLCLRYTRQSELSSFVQDVLNHIGGSIYPDRSTGRLALSLIRGDYDIDVLPLFTYDTGLISLEDDETASQDDVVNECIVKWVDPIGKEERSARIQNIASRQATGAINSTTTNYTGVPTVDLALRLAQRDLKAGATSLKRFKVVLDRRAWRIVPGDAFRISVPQKGIYNAILRAGKVSEGGHEDGRITVEAVLDVFGLPSSSFITPEQGAWTPPDRTVSVPEKRIVREATYVEVFYALDPANLQLLSPEAGTIATIVGRPSSLTQAYDLEVLAGGETNPRRGIGAFAPYVISSAIIPVEAGPTIIPFESASDVGLIEIGSMVQVGAEICRLDAITADPGGYSGTITVARGCVDTIPQEHPLGSTIYFVTGDEVGGDGREYAAGEVVNVKVLPYSSSAKLDPELATTDVVNIMGRQGRPYPPANLKVNDTPYAEVESVSGLIKLTWAHRDRVIQQDRLVDHTEASIGPEADTSYRVLVFKGDTYTPVRTVNGITDPEFTYTPSMATEDEITDSIWFELDTIRSSLASRQKYRFGFESDFPSGPVITPLLQVSNPGGSAFNGNAFTRIPFYTPTLNVGGAFTTNNKWTVPATGTYRIRLDVGFAGATTPLLSGETWDLKIDNFTGPTTAPVAGQSSAGTFDGTAPASLDVTVELTAGQVLSAYLRTNHTPHITVASAMWRIEQVIN
ncbi:phage tail protein [Aquamicrobium zhengzhouense]|uniref:Tip attachment protein J domain-containing protein n=1 Tax=Aquamicrobium zhengzhouense TaxID=2781738 RepID=A0ABS0S9Q9_9HYPH|nr:phage tail protein [Aquamicrobium zhengzhouense]MBI1620025.1 hypothetical protein [Aquamicrobium zhengzhouense]